MARNAGDAEKFSPFAHGDKSGPAQTAACRIMIADIAAYLVDAEKFS
jgi:hypothetical protein